MEDSIKIISKSKNFTYQESAVKSKKFKIRLVPKRKLFELYEDSSDDEIGPIDKKVKIIKQTVNYTQSITASYQSKDYKKCLDFIDEFFKLPDNNNESANRRKHYRMIQAACWTMLDMKREETFKTLNEILKQEPSNSFAHYGVGLAQYRDGDLSSCLKAFGIAIKLNPTAAMKRAMELKAKAKSIIEMISDAKIQFEMNNCSRAVEMLYAAARIDPDNFKVLKNIANIRNQFLKELVEHLERDIKRKFPNKYNEIEKIIKSNQLAKAEKMINEIGRNETTENGQLTYLKGFVLYIKGSFTESLMFFKKAQLESGGPLEKIKMMELKTLKLQEIVMKGLEQMNTGKYEEAIETLTKIIVFDKDNRVIIQAAYFQRALAHFNLGNFTEAFEDYKKFEIINKHIGNILTVLIEDKKEDFKLDSNSESVEEVDKPND